MAFANTVIGYPIEAPVVYENLVVTKILFDTHGQMKKELGLAVKLHDQRVKLIGRMKKTYGKFLKKEISMVVVKVKPEKAPKKGKAPKKEKAPREAEDSPKIVTVVGVPVDAPTSLPLVRQDTNGILVVYPRGITRVVDDDVGLVREVFGCDPDNTIVNGEVIEKEVVTVVGDMVNLLDNELVPLQLLLWL